MVPVSTPNAQSMNGLHDAQSANDLHNAQSANVLSSFPAKFHPKDLCKDRHRIPDLLAGVCLRS